jgi:hypothetical protein
VTLQWSKLFVHLSKGITQDLRTREVSKHAQHPKSEFQESCCRYSSNAPIDFNNHTVSRKTTHRSTRHKVVGLQLDDIGYLPFHLSFPHSPHRMSRHEAPQNPRYPDQRLKPSLASILPPNHDQPYSTAAEPPSSSGYLSPQARKL